MQLKAKSPSSFHETNHAKLTRRVSAANKSAAQKQNTKAKSPSSFRETNYAQQTRRVSAANKSLAQKQNSNGKKTLRLALIGLGICLLVGVLAYGSNVVVTSLNSISSGRTGISEETRRKLSRQTMQLRSSTPNKASANQQQNASQQAFEDSEYAPKPMPLGVKVGIMVGFLVCSVFFIWLVLIGGFDKKHRMSVGFDVDDDGENDFFMHS